MFRHWFNRRRGQSEPPADPMPPARAPLEINLVAAQRSQAIIEISLDGAPGIYQSTILGVDTQAGLIAIDQIFPAGFAAEPGRHVTVTLRLGERREQFGTHIVAREDDGERYQLRLPPSVGYRQRRSVYRLPLRGGGAVGSEFNTGSVRYAALVRDISPLGIRLALPAWLPLATGALLENLEFELLGERFRCAAKVRNVRSTGGSGTEIGAEFSALARPQQRALERLIMQAQRREAQQQREAGALFAGAALAR